MDSTVKAWHGSPYDHNGFSMHMVGQGEGANGYGWGLYFADQKAIAEHYQVALSQTHWQTSQGVLQYHVLIDKLVQAMERKGVITSFLAMRQVAINVVEAVESAGGTQHYLQQYEPPKGHYLPFYEAAHGELESLDPVRCPGVLYRVALAPQDHEYLDWDRPIAGQSPRVQAIVESLNADLMLIHPSRLAISTGERFYRELKSHYGHLFTEQVDNPQERASRTLLAAGIPGVKYLNGVSRQAGEGGYNYVIFDASLVRILGKYEMTESRCIDEDTEELEFGLSPR